MYALCTHIKSSDGKVCQSPALRGTDLCHFHYRWRKQGRDTRRPVTPPKPARPQKLRALPFEFDDLDTPESIQTALALVANAVAKDTLDHNRASAILYAIQMANANIRNLNYEPLTEDQQEEDLRKLEEHFKAMDAEADSHSTSSNPA